MPDLMRPLENRRSNVDRINSHGIKIHVYSVDSPVVGVGEAIIEIPFPVLFVERPGFTSGFSLDENVSPQLTNFPTYSAVVVQWVRQPKKTTSDNANSFLYAGAILSVRLTGDVSQRATLHTRFEGKAMRNPLTDYDLDLTSVL